MLKKIISGGQTGADIAAIDAAMSINFKYGGCLPNGRKTENGPLDQKYIMHELETGGYPKRTERNILDSDGTVIFHHGKLAGGSRLTRDLALRYSKPCINFDLNVVSVSSALDNLKEWVSEYEIEILNIAGSRASKDHEIYDKVFNIIKNLIASI